MSAGLLALLLNSLSPTLRKSSSKRGLDAPLGWHTRLVPHARPPTLITPRLAASSAKQGKGRSAPVRRSPRLRVGLPAPDPKKAWRCSALAFRDVFVAPSCVHVRALPRPPWRSARVRNQTGKARLPKTRNPAMGDRRVDSIMLRRQPYPCSASARLARPNTLEPGGTDSISHTFPPITEPAPITVSPPRMVAPE
jgi:hypothetical protein